MGSIKINDSRVYGLSLYELNMHDLAMGIRGVARALEWSTDLDGVPGEEVMQRMATELSSAASILADINSRLICVFAETDVLQEAIEAGKETKA